MEFQLIFKEQKQILIQDAISKHRSHTRAIFRGVGGSANKKRGRGERERESKFMYVSQ